MTPESVGVPKNDIVLGKHSGRHALLSRYEELGFSLDAGEITENLFQVYGTGRPKEKYLRSGPAGDPARFRSGRGGCMSANRRI